MVTINLFGLYHAKRKLDTVTSSSTNQNGEREESKEAELSQDEQRSYDVILEFTCELYSVPWINPSARD